MVCKRGAVQGAHRRTGSRRARMHGNPVAGVIVHNPGPASVQPEPGLTSRLKPVFVTPRKRKSLYYHTLFSILVSVPSTRHNIFICNTPWKSFSTSLRQLLHRVDGRHGKRKKGATRSGIFSLVLRLVVANIAPAIFFVLLSSCTLTFLPLSAPWRCDSQRRRPCHRQEFLADPQSTNRA
jgi:hypothetical protein